MFEQTNLGNPGALSAMQTVVTGPLKLRTLERGWSIAWLHGHITHADYRELGAG
jgi:hypothetical protein